jgi:hypothetical protein
MYFGVYKFVCTFLIVIEEKNYDEVNGKSDEPRTQSKHFRKCFVAKISRNPHNNIT